MHEEYEVEIDGQLFTVRRISAIEQILAEKEGTELSEKLGDGQAELIARACILSKSLYSENAPVFESGYEVLEKLTAEKVYELTNRETVTKQVTERVVEKRTEVFEKEAQSFQDYSLPEISEETTENVSLRQKAEELSRFLERDSRRYDGYFDMF